MQSLGSFEVYTYVDGAKGTLETVLIRSDAVEEAIRDKYYHGSNVISWFIGSRVDIQDLEHQGTIDICDHAEIIPDLLIPDVLKGG